MAKSKKAKKPEIPELDPILPLAAGYEIPDLKQGEGRDVFKNTKPVMVELPWRAMWTLWEFAEVRAREDYPKYVKGPLSHVAQARLEAVRAFRSAVMNQGDPIFVMDEDEAQKLRADRAAAAKAKIKADKERMKKARDAKRQKELCAHNSTKKIKRGDQKYLKCLECGSSWERAASESPSKRPEGSDKRKTAPKASAAPGRSSAGKKAKKTAKS